VIFDIRHNKYRLITVIHYAKSSNHLETEGHVYIRSFLTHKEYNNPRIGTGRTVKMTAVLANPAEMIAHGAPHLIHNEKEFEAYTDALFELTVLKRPSASEREAIELLTLLIERYEQEHY
jgi:hypothetical protein